MQSEIEKYLPYLDGEDMTLEEKVAYVRFVIGFTKARVDQVFDPSQT